MVKTQKSPCRHGFTIIELLVSIFIIGLLISLLLPAVQQVRASALRIQCMNNLRNVSLAMLQVMESQGRFPPCGRFGDGTPETAGSYGSWVLDILPWIEQSAIADQWDYDQAYNSHANILLTEAYIPVLTCPADITVLQIGDLSYVVNGGIGFTIQTGGGVHDCPFSPGGGQLDLNANGIVCPPTPEESDHLTDKDIFYSMGLFFNETWKGEVRSKRHHRPATVNDGMSQTLLFAENARTGTDPERSESSWASNNPYLTSFYIGNPCDGADCSEGKVDYSRSNSGSAAINSGLTSSEGSSPYPNSFHKGGVMMSFCDGHVQFISESINGNVYAALVSPQGMRLKGTPLAQQIVTGAEF